MEYFNYGEKEITHLKSKDKLLGKAIDEIGHIYRLVTLDFFTALISQILSQQISAKAAATVCGRMQSEMGEVTPKALWETDVEVIQKWGTTMRKASYIKAFSQSVLSGEFDLGKLHTVSDDEVCVQLSKVKGIGKWTAEMLMTFSMQRPDIMSWDDLAIHRGLRMLYRHKTITKELFAKYKRRYSPYATVASLYLWEISSSESITWNDPAQKKKKQ